MKDFINCDYLFNFFKRFEVSTQPKQKFVILTWFGEEAGSFELLTRSTKMLFVCFYFSLFYQNPAFFVIALEMISECI